MMNPMRTVIRLKLLGKDGFIIVFKQKRKMPTSEPPPPYPLVLRFLVPQIVITP